MGGRVGGGGVHADPSPAVREASPRRPASPPARRRDALVIHSPVVELPEAPPGYDDWMGGVDLRVELRVVPHVSADLGEEGNSRVYTPEPSTGRAEVTFHRLTWFYWGLIKQVNFDHLPGERLPRLVHLFSPDTELFIRYSRDELRPASSNNTLLRSEVLQMSFSLFMPVQRSPRLKLRLRFVKVDVQELLKLRRGVGGRQVGKRG